MSKRAVLRLDGNLEQGFQVTLEIGEEGKVYFTEVNGYLPPNSELLQCLDQWEENYRQISESTRIKLKKVIIQTGALSQVETCRQLAQELQRHLKKWLESSAFQDVEKRLREVLNNEEPIRVLLRAQDNRLRKLPWHLWEFVEKYALAEIAFSTAPGQISFRIKPREKVRVLAILGNSEGIDTEADRKMLKELPNAEVLFLAEPSRQQINDQLWDQPWDIFFFAGHSETKDNQGRIYINRDDSLTLDELKYSLKQAITHGLQLAIFNSCDGLGLASELEQLHLPQLIVMREPVPDKVAQEFLKHFLGAFARGDSLYVAERKARERLQGMENDFPCASWLPVIFQNPTATPPTWEKLPNPSGGKQPRNFWRRVGALFGASVVVTGAVMGVRALGWLQPLELPAYDQMMRWRSSDEGQDKRLLLITIDDADIAYQQEQGWKRRWSLSDEALNRLLQFLEQHKARAIGLDIVRDAKVDPELPDLAKRLKKSDSFYVVCAVHTPGDRKSGTKPPPEVPVGRQGFSNVVQDIDGVVRRHLLSMDKFPTSPCTTAYALSSMLAFSYLHKQGIEPSYTQEGNLQLGKVIFKRLQAPSGGYQKLDTRGNQVLLNYRSYDSPFEITDTVTLTQVLTGGVKPEFVENRIILIGAITSTVIDHFPTPYTKGQRYYQEMPGVILHAQMVSHILSSVLDNRPLLSVLPFWEDSLWVLTWSLVGGIVALFYSAKTRLAFTGIVAIVILGGICYALFNQGYWLPFFPSCLALILTGGIMLIYSHRFTTDYYR